MSIARDSSSGRGYQGNLPGLPLYILAGGESSRFGSNKARADIHGRPMILRVWEELVPAAASVAVIGRKPQEFEDLGLRTLVDEEPGLGPLGGLCRALDDAAEPWVLVTCCDILGLRASWIQQLWEERGGASAVVFEDERLHPFPGIYHRVLLPDVRERLAGGDRSMMGLLDSCEARLVEPPSDWGSVVRIDRSVDLQNWKAEGRR